MQKSNKTKWLKAVRPLTFLLVITLLLSYMTYAWIRRDWNLTIQQEGMQVATGGSLVFQFDDNETSTGKTVNEILGVEDFELKPVSNISGLSTDFFNLNFLGGKGNEYFQNLKRSGNQTSYTDLGILNGYVEMRFMLLCPGEDTSTRYVYLSPDCKIENSADIGIDVASCIRISITIDESNGFSNGTTYIFGNREDDGTAQAHSAVTNAKNPDGTFVADGKNFYNGDGSVNRDYIADYTPNGGKLYSFDQFNGGQIDSDDTEFAHDTKKVLFSMSGGARRWITVRIWLEGEDPLCTDEITGADVDLLLKFSSFT